MVWNKTPESIVNIIIQALQDITVSYQTVADMLEIPKATVGNIARRSLDSNLKKARYSEWCRQIKIGDKNHMFNRTGMSHHNAVEGYTQYGNYLYTFPPDWWEGSRPKGRIGVHILTWVTANNLKALPKGWVVHHIDNNPLNNRIENLQGMTISDHMKLHGRIRNEQRLSRKGVENSVLEAHGNS